MPSERTRAWNAPLPITYRFRPNGNVPESSIMEIMFLFSKTPDGSHPPIAPMRLLGPGQDG